MDNQVSVSKLKQLRVQASKNGNKALWLELNSEIHERLGTINWFKKGV